MYLLTITTNQSLLFLIGDELFRKFFLTWAIIVGIDVGIRWLGEIIAEFVASFDLIKKLLNYINPQTTYSL